MAKYKITIVRRYDTTLNDYDPYLTGVEESCGYTVVSNHDCVTTAEIGNVGGTDLESDNRKEIARKRRGFVIKIQGHFDIQYGDYIAFVKITDTGSYMYFYKIISILESELFNGCCKLFITGENLQARECQGIEKVCGETDYVLG